MKFMTIREASGTARVSYGTIRNACLDGKLRCYRLGRGQRAIRIDAESFRRFLEASLFEPDTLATETTVDEKGAIRLPRRRRPDAPRS